MARHSHFHNIMLKKGAADRARGKIFTKHARLIAVAAAKGGDPSMNSSLRIAIDNARLDNMPKENIERAIKKGTGEDKEAAALSECVYEGFGPAGIALLISVITDNKNRTLGAIKLILNRYGGRIAESGSVSWMFEQKGQIRVKGSSNKEEDELKFIDAGADDIESLDDGEFFVYTKPQDLAVVEKNLEQAGFQIMSAELNFMPKNIIKIEDVDAAKRTLGLIDALNEEDDVLKVAGNFEVTDELTA